jgi:hypothetical protein
MILKGTSLKKDKKCTDEKYMTSIINLNVINLNITKIVYLFIYFYYEI